MGADYWTSASVRLVAEGQDEVVVPRALIGMGEYNRSHTVWFHDVGLPDTQTLQAQLGEVERFLVDHRQDLADADARVDVFVGWSPDISEEAVVRLSLLDAMCRVDGDLVLDVHNSDPRFIDDDDERRYWSRLTVVTGALDGSPGDMLTNNDHRRTGDLAAEWADLVAKHLQILGAQRAPRRVLLEWIPADQDGLVLSRRLVNELSGQRLDFAIRVNDDFAAGPGPRTVSSHATRAPLAAS